LISRNRELIFSAEGSAATTQDNTHETVVMGRCQFFKNQYHRASICVTRSGLSARRLSVRPVKVA